MSMGYQAGKVSETGNVRQVNEDRVLLQQTVCGKRRVLLAAVADGMGGLSHGERASASVTELLLAWWEETIERAGAVPEIERVSSALDFLLEEANRKIMRLASADGSRMGTTLSLVFLSDKRLLMKQIGDSRIYLFDKKQIVQLTKDQTWCQQEVDAGRMTEALKEVHEKRHMLVNALGVKEEFYIEGDVRELKKGQRLLLCSDGYYSYLFGNGVYKGLLGFGNPQALLERSVEKIMEGTAEDNLSAVLVVI